MATSRSGPGSTIPVERALAAVATQLRPHLVPTVPAGKSLRLRDRGGDLPEVVLGLRRERRLFSRTFPLTLDAQEIGPGPPSGGLVELHKARWGHRTQLRWRTPVPPKGEWWLERLEGTGLIRGAQQMTSVQVMTLAWESADHRWKLHMETLAGAVIASGPLMPILVPLEPDDVEGILTVLRSFVATCRG
jgi:hypothetical protein